MLRSCVLLLLAVCVCAAAVGVSADSTLNSTVADSSFTPSNDRLFDAFGLDVTQAVDSAMLTLSIPRVASTSQIVRTAEGECCDCVGKVAKHIIESLLDQVKTKCENTTCPFIKQRCEWIEEHKEEFAGYTVAKVRPGALGFSYCMGTGECKHPNMTSSSIVNYARPDASQHWAQMSASVSFVNRLLSTESKRAMFGEGGEYRMQLDESQMSDKRRAMSLFELLIGEEERVSQKNIMGRERCHRCIKHGVRFVMRRAVHHVKRVCKHTECPKLKEFCKWAKEHKKFFRGVIYERIRPPQSAIAWCFGRRQCRHEEKNELTTIPFSMKPEEEEEAKARGIVTGRAGRMHKRRLSKD